MKQYPFATKEIREEDEEKRMAHKKEFDITSTVNHQNVIKSQYYFFDELKKKINIVMNYIEGKEVLDLIAEQPEGVYTECDAKFLFKQMMEGI